MNKSKLKSYAPEARQDFIAMVQSRAAQLGISDAKGQLQIEPCEVQGQVAIIAGQAFPAKIANQRNVLIARMQKDGFAATVEAIAYTWFNRFAALRYMELKNYLSHGQRVLSSVTEGGLPDILTHALELVESGDLPGISVAEVSELKLASKDGELYKRLLVAQCNQLATHMGFLFERIDDDSELLLPDNLLRTDSVIRKLVDSIDESDWDQVEIIGWLYQFYISEKKDQVIGKVVQSADIPAATQLFTPNWIVKYLVQNSVGRLWLQANPTSTLASQMQYYIAPAEQTPEVNAQLDALIRARISEDGDTLNPESISVLDPACGSGHILVEAYDLLKAIYLERGYRERDIPRLILEKNLFGLDIDDRAAQLAAFALLMKARADDRRLFSEPVQLNVLSLQESVGLDAAQLAQDLGLSDAAERNALNTLLSIFTQAKTFGSLLQIPHALAQALPQLAARIAAAQSSGDLYTQFAAATLQPLLQQAQVLARQYDAVVANPPYMGNNGMNDAVKTFAKKEFPDSKSDLFAMFIERGFGWCKPSGFNSMVTMQNWMFLSSYQTMREKLLTTKTITSLIQIGYNSFPEINSKVAQACAFSVLAQNVDGFCGRYIDLNSASQSADKNIVFIERTSSLIHDVFQGGFQKIPGSPIAFWLSDQARHVFKECKNVSGIAAPRQGLITGDNEKFLRFWQEISIEKAAFEYADNAKWYPINKGGDFRKWYGNREYVVNWESNGQDIKNFKDQNGKLRSRPQNLEFNFSEHVSWSLITSGDFSVRYYDASFSFNVAGISCFPSGKDVYLLLCFLNTKIANYLTKAINPTLNSNVGDVGNLPVIEVGDAVQALASACLEYSKSDWNAYERSWGFEKFPLLSINNHLVPKLESSYAAWINQNQKVIAEIKKIEEENNRLFIDVYGLADQLTPDVQLEQITLTVNPVYRYGSNLTEEEQITRFRKDTMVELVSYAIGCMMGRYSLDEPGLVYAHAGNVGFDPQRYTRFAADGDGIVPVSDLPWFTDDATNRVKEFLVAVWGQETLAENLAWLADSLGRKADETAEDALRRYISGSFFKDHCQTYKKRPIYWLFSSGKQKAFEALVYLHRYNDSTLARMRAEYVVPLTGRMMERIKLLEDDSIKASTGAAKKAIDKQIDKLKKKLEELRLFDEKLRHYADQRITIDLDDGVKVNYGKFGDLLDNVKGITGGAGDD